MKAKGLGLHDVDAHHAGGDVVVTYCHERPPEAAACDAQRQDDHAGCDDAVEIVEADVAVEGEPEELRRCDLQAVGGAEPRCRQIDHREMEDELRRYGGERHVEALDAHGRQPEQQAEQGGGYAGRRDRHEEGQGPMAGNAGGGERADAHEGRLSEVDLAGIAQRQLQAGHRHRQDEHVVADVRVARAQQKRHQGERHEQDTERAPLAARSHQGRVLQVR
jgi:hypothetical protein